MITVTNHYSTTCPIESCDPRMCTVKEEVLVSPFVGAIEDR